jgi:hypothetical protein
MWAPPPPSAQLLHQETFVVSAIYKKKADYIERGGFFFFSFARSIGTQKHIVDAYAVQVNRVVSDKKQKNQRPKQAITHSLSSVCC